MASERFTLTEPSIVLRIPIEEGYVPNVFVQVDLVGAAERTGDAAAAAGAGAEGQSKTDLPKRPAYARGELNLAVPPLARTLAVEAKPQAEKLEPGGSTALDVLVKDAKGNPVPGAELAVAVVDEAILALTGYDIPDPITTFYAERGADVTDAHNRGYIVLANPMQLEDQVTANTAEAGLGMDMASGAAATQAPMPAAAPSMEKAAREAEGAAPDTPITVRTDFNPLAHWSPAVPTDAQGRGRLTIKVPDNLTRYRVMVVAAAGAASLGRAHRP